MTLSDADTAQLWETFRAGGGAELVRGAVRLVLQELIEAEATEAVGAGRYERSEARVNERNGHRPRLLATQAGDVELRIPTLRKGSLLPSVLEPRRRIDRALHAVIMEAYVAGVSTRSVDDLVAALGAESGISKSEVSRICAGLDDMVEAFRSRRLDHVEFPYVYLDATYLKVRNSVSQVASMAMVVATGVTADGNREILGCDIGNSESEGFWQSFLGSLRSRVLTGVRLVIADAHAGLAAAADRTIQGAGRQRCRVHFIRIDRPWGSGMSCQSLAGFRLIRRRCVWRALATRSCRAVSSVQPRALASSRSTRMSASCSVRMSARCGSGAKLAHCSQMLA